MEDEFPLWSPYVFCRNGCGRLDCNRNIESDFAKEYMENSVHTTLNELKKCSKFVDKAKLDNVNRPKHYVKTCNGIEHECKDTIAIIISDESGDRAFYLGNAVKYLWRYKTKNGVEDLKKAIKNIEMIIDNIGEEGV